MHCVSGPASWIICVTYTDNGSRLECSIPSMSVDSAVSLYKNLPMRKFFILKRICCVDGFTW